MQCDTLPGIEPIERNRHDLRQINCKVRHGHINIILPTQVPPRLDCIPRSRVRVPAWPALSIILIQRDTELVGSREYDVQIPLSERHKVRTVQSRHLRVEVLVRIFWIETRVVSTTISINIVVHVKVLASAVPEAKIVAVTVLERVDDKGVSVPQLGLHETHAILDGGGRCIYRWELIDVRDVSIDDSGIAHGCARDGEEAGKEDDEHHVGYGEGIEETAQSSCGGGSRFEADGVNRPFQSLQS